LARTGTKVISLCAPGFPNTRRSAVDTPGCRPNDGPVTYNLAELFERVVDTVPEREAVVTPTRRLTFGDLDARANQLAHHLRAAGIGPGDHVGLQLMNGVEYLEAMLAAFKLRAVPVNVNYRYVESELSYLYENADLVALVYDTSFSTRVDAALRTTGPRHLVAVRRTTVAALPGSVEYESALASASSERDFAGRSGDDLYIAYTGGTTGLPKGVLWRHEDIFFAAMGGGDPTTMLGPITEPDQIVERVLPIGAVMLMTPPLIHVSAQWGAFSMMYGGSSVVLTSPGSFDPIEVLRLVATESVNVLTLVGDAMARPLLDALAHHPDRYDMSSLIVFASGGAVLSASTKAQVAELLPGVIAVDGLGSTETGVTGTRARLPGADVEQGAKFTVGENIAVLDDALQPVAPGSDCVGHVARKGHLPLGYYNDAEKSAALMVEVDGERWALTGDAATVEEDGTVVLLGRGSVSINTGGEKAYPEEVEAVVKDHPAVYDAVVVGTPDARWGERVVAIVELRPGATLTLDDLREHCRHLLAGYKLPRELMLVGHVERGPNGKADYRWARERAISAICG
jgi:3-oxocholest-4-en-26-oate---CoA ligase